MTSLNLDNNQASYQIKAYQPGHLQVNDRILTASVILAPHELLENWPPQTIAALTAEMLDLGALKVKPDLLLLGTGSNLVFIPAEIYGHLINQGIGVEVMSTSAACRTYAVLSAEDRNVAAALIIR